MYDATASADWWALAPVALVVLSLWVFPPPAEYVVGGKDPGVYMNAGVQIAQRGSLVIEDELVSSLPAETRGLFFPRHYGQPYYSNRFMGFFLVNPDLGTVVDQFPHLYPVAVAIGYDMAGLTGARYASTACAVIGVLALYFLGARLIGKPAGAAAAGLLAIHLVQVWHARIAELGDPRAGAAAGGAARAGACASGRRRVFRAGRGGVVGPAAVCALRRGARRRPRRGGIGPALDRRGPCARQHLSRR